MLENLPEEKRKILLKYPFIVDFLKGEMKKELFLKDLEAFQSDLDSQGITKEDLAKIVESKVEIPDIVKNKIKKCNKMIASDKLIARADSSSKLSILFKDCTFGSDECLYNLSISDYLEGKESLRVSISDQMQSTGKYTETYHKRHMGMYKELCKTLKNKKKALLAIALGYSWFFGGIPFEEKLDYSFNTFLTMIPKDIKYAYYLIIEVQKDIDLDDLKEKYKDVEWDSIEDAGYKEEIFLFHHFLKTFYEYMGVGYDDVRRHYLDYLGEKPEYSIYEIPEGAKGYFTDEEHKLFEQLKKDNKQILKDPKKYLLIFSRVILRMFGPSTFGHEEAIRFNYDILVMLDKSIVEREEMKRHWGIIKLHGKRDNFSKGVLGIVCMVSNKAFYEEVTNAMLKLTEKDPELKIPIYDARFKLWWPK